MYPIQFQTNLALQWSCHCKSLLVVLWCACVCVCVGRGGVLVNGVLQYGTYISFCIIVLRRSTPPPPRRIALPDVLCTHSRVKAFHLHAYAFNSSELHSQWSHFSGPTLITLVPSSVTLAVNWTFKCTVTMTSENAWFLPVSTWMHRQYRPRKWKWWCITALLSALQITSTQRRLNDGDVLKLTFDDMKKVFHVIRSRV
jgi:hypothetical protein